MEIFYKDDGYLETVSQPLKLGFCYNSYKGYCELLTSVLGIFKKKQNSNVGEQQDNRRAQPF